MLNGSHLFVLCCKEPNRSANDMCFNIHLFSAISKRIYNNIWQQRQHIQPYDTNDNCFIFLVVFVWIKTTKVAPLTLREFLNDTTVAYAGELLNFVSGLCRIVHKIDMQLIQINPYLNPTGQIPLLLVYINLLPSFEHIFHCDQKIIYTEKLFSDFLKTEAVEASQSGCLIDNF